MKKLFKLFKEVRDLLSRKIFFYTNRDIDSSYVYVQKQHSALLSSKGEVVTQIDCALFKARQGFDVNKPMVLINIIYDCEKDNIIDMTAVTLDNVRKC